MNKLHEEEFDGYRRAGCMHPDCGWNEHVDGAVSARQVTRVAREHARLKGHRVTITTARILQLTPMKYRNGKWYANGKQERRSRLERQATPIQQEKKLAL